MEPLTLNIKDLKSYIDEAISTGKCAPNTWDGLENTIKRHNGYRTTLFGDEASYEASVENKTSPSIFKLCRALVTKFLGRGLIPNIVTPLNSLGVNISHNDVFDLCTFIAMVYVGTNKFSAGVSYNEFIFDLLAPHIRTCNGQKLSERYSSYTDLTNKKPRVNSSRNSNVDTHFPDDALDLIKKEADRFRHERDKELKSNCYHQARLTNHVYNNSTRAKNERPPDYTRETGYGHGVKVSTIPKYKYLDYQINYYLRARAKYNLPRKDSLTTKSIQESSLGGKDLKRQDRKGIIKCRNHAFEAFWKPIFEKTTIQLNLQMEPHAFYDLLRSVERLSPKALTEENFNIYRTAISLCIEEYSSFRWLDFYVFQQKVTKYYVDDEVHSKHNEIQRLPTALNHIPFYKLRLAAIEAIRLYPDSLPDIYLLVENIELACNLATMAVYAYASHAETHSPVCYERFLSGLEVNLRIEPFINPFL